MQVYDVIFCTMITMAIVRFHIVEIQGKCKYILTCVYLLINKCRLLHVFEATSESQFDLKNM